jgi:hypothetical protein
MSKNYVINLLLFASVLILLYVTYVKNKEISMLRLELGLLSANYQRAKNDLSINNECLKQTFRNQDVDLGVQSNDSLNCRMVIRFSSRHCDDCITSLLRLLKKTSPPSRILSR